LISGSIGAGTCPNLARKSRQGHGET